MQILIGNVNVREIPNAGKTVLEVRIRGMDCVTVCGATGPSIGRIKTTNNTDVTQETIKNRFG